MSGLSISQSIEAPLTLRDTLTLGGSISTQNGTGKFILCIILSEEMEKRLYVPLQVQVRLSFRVKDYCQRTVG